MSSPGERVAARHIAKTAPFTPDRVQQVIRDLETFLKNLDRIDDPQDHDRLRVIINDWGNKLRAESDALFRYLQNLAISDPKVKSVDRQMVVYHKQLRPLSLASSVIRLPSQEYWYDRDVRYRWRDDVIKVVRDLPEVAKFLDSLRKRKKIVPEVPDASTQNMNVDGFPAKLTGFDQDDPEHVTAFHKLRSALKEYRRACARVFPALARRTLPLDLRFDVKSLLAPAGQYGNEAITLNVLNLGDVRHVIYTLAHEMGHHFGISLLSHGARAFWIQMYKGDWGSLDLREILQAWPSHQNSFEWENDLKRSNPILYLQLQSLLGGHVKLPKPLQDNWSREAVERYLAEGGNPTVKVPQTPITAYGSTNPDEGFAEAVALLVAYGPQALHPQIRQWLEIALPGELRTANRVL